jgi:hypothetical protein
VKWIFSTLDSSFERTDFDCGRQSLNDYIKKYASQNMRAGYSITLFISDRRNPQIVFIKSKIDYFSFSLFAFLFWRKLFK